MAEIFPAVSASRGGADFPLIVDSHCHLNFPDYNTDLADVISRARTEGVRVMQTICTDMAEFDEVHAIAQAHEGIYCSVGVHPNESGKTAIVPLSALVAATQHPKVIGIGETGLDYYYDTSDRASQQESFRVHIACAQATGLPLIIHTRNADEDMALMLSEAMKNKQVRGVLHCFTSSRQLAEKALKLGFYISISGIISFKNAQELRDIVKDIPLERLLVETDAPYLAPMPYRGKRNEPSYVRHTNRVVAKLKGISEEACAIATTDNFFKLFDKAKRPDGAQA